MYWKVDAGCWRPQILPLRLLCMLLRGLSTWWQDSYSKSSENQSESGNVSYNIIAYYSCGGHTLSLPDHFSARRPILIGCRREPCKCEYQEVGIFGAIPGGGLSTPRTITWLREEGVRKQWRWKSPECQKKRDLRCEQIPGTGARAEMSMVHLEGRLEASCKGKVQIRECGDKMGTRWEDWEGHPDCCIP